MKRYCFDTSGITNPLETMPQDIHESMWRKIESILASGDVAVNREIYDEMVHIEGSVGDCIRANASQLVLEIQDNGWDWQTYLAHVTSMQATYQQYISEYNNDRKNTVCLNDISIIALAKTLGLPLVQMEFRSAQPSNTKKRIPSVCDNENVLHYTFSEFLRLEKVKF